MAYSPLAKLIRKRESDHLKAENLFILASATVVIALMLANQFAWAFIREDVLANPRGEVAITYWLVQLTFASLFLFTCIIGFKPATTVTCTKNAVNIQNGDLHISVPYSSVQNVQTVSSEVYHRHYRRYQATLGFINGVQAEYVLLKTASHPVILGLSAEDMQAFMAYVENNRVEAKQTVSFDELALVA